jgi:hypothetical protein
LKALLNNLWGKLTQKPNKTKTRIINDSNEWIKLISDDKFSVIRADYSNNKYLQVFYKDNEEICESSSKSNVVLGAFITAYGRLKLLKEMNKLRRRVIYVDTDSIFFWTEEGLSEPKTGPNLGDFTNEISKEKGDYIVEMVAAGEKFYGYKTNKNYTHALCKGVAFNNLTSLKLNFDTMKEIVIEDNSKEINVEQLNFIRNKKEWSIKTEVGNKTIKNTYNKRQVLENMVETIPFGY